MDRRILKQGQDVTWECYVTWDMVLSGTQGAEQTIEALGGAGNAKGKVVVVEGTAEPDPPLTAAALIIPSWRKSRALKSSIR